MLRSKRDVHNTLPRFEVKQRILRLSLNFLLHLFCIVLRFRTAHRCEGAILVSFAFVSSVFLSTFFTTARLIWLTASFRIALRRRYGAHYRAICKRRKRRFEKSCVFAIVRMEKQQIVQNSYFSSAISLICDAFTNFIGDFLATL